MALLTSTAEPQTRLILIKHAMPEIDTSVSSHLWPLSEHGRIACLRLATEIAVYAPEIIVTSIEPKAFETGELLANLLGLPCETAPGLQENDRTGIDFLNMETYESTFQRFFMFPDELTVGRETANRASSRFCGAVERVLEAHPSSTVAIVAHGTVISLFLRHVAAINPFLVWQRLQLPS